LKLCGKLSLTPGSVCSKDLSSLIPIRRDAPGLTGAEQKAKRLEKTTRLLMENIEQNERRLQALEELLPKIPVHSSASDSSGN